MLGFFTTLAIGHIPSFSLTRLPTRREPPVMSATLPASDISRVVCDIAISSVECLVPSGTITLYGAGDAGQGACVCPSPVWRRVGWAVGWVTVDAGACRSTLPPHLNPPPQGGEDTDARRPQVVGRCSAQQNRQFKSPANLGSRATFRRHSATLPEPDRPRVHGRRDSVPYSR
jgi:hypothetical protein